MLYWAQYMHIVFYLKKKKFLYECASIIFLVLYQFRIFNVLIFSCLHKFFHAKIRLLLIIKQINYWLYYLIIFLILNWNFFVVSYFILFLSLSLYFFSMNDIRAVGDGDGEGPLTWGAIQTLLLNEGENISQTDLESYLSALLGTGIDIPEHSSYDSNNFTESILGFESWFFSVDEIHINEKDKFGEKKKNTYRRLCYFFLFLSVSVYYSEEFYHFRTFVSLGCEDIDYWLFLPISGKIMVWFVRILILNCLSYFHRENPNQQAQNKFIMSVYHTYARWI